MKDQNGTKLYIGAELYSTQCPDICPAKCINIDANTARFEWAAEYGNKTFILDKKAF